MIYQIKEKVEKLPKTDWNKWKLNIIGFKDFKPSQNRCLIEYCPFCKQERGTINKNCKIEYHNE